MALIQSEFEKLGGGDLLGGDKTSPLTSGETGTADGGDTLAGTVAKEFSGPAPTPAEDQTGAPGRVDRNRTPPPGPPPIVGAAMGAGEGSTTTGGVGGSFRQAGTSGFNQRFGSNSPALWFRRNQESLGGHNTLREQQSARSGGGGAGIDLPAPSSASPGGTGDEIGGRPGDIDWEQFLKQVQANMFRPGG